jgi:enediyne biosynthesis protein E4
MRSCEKFFFGLLVLVLVGCGEKKESRSSPTLFQCLDSTQTNISFLNELTYNEQVNTYTFRNFYNGGGVGIGDFNNDGLQDIFFSGNMVPSRLYLNEGAFKFRDISKISGMSRPGAWTTGVSIADINSDGFIDIYLCKSGPPDSPFRSNELFINNGDLTFTERAADYGLNFKGLSTHAAFFDYDKDGDLDCYLLNNSIRSVGGYDLRKGLREIPDTLGGNKLLKNVGNRFVDVSTESGIYSSQIGFGLGVTIGDIDKDSWPDIYVSNDFFEKDYLYINQRNGKFRESLEDYMREISLGSMGADMADINNDALPDIFVTEMLPDTDERLKTTSQFESWDKYQIAVRSGYYRQFSRNVLQLNNGNKTFSEISRLAGVSATDWSWGALIFDMNNDGLKDIFVANGIYKDLLDQDYVNFIAQPHLIREMLRRERNVITRLVDSIPSNKIPNYAFYNKGDFAFEDKSAEWGLGQASHSNGSAYADLDNDGDLEIILNNVNMPAMVYRNMSRELMPLRNSLTLNLHGEGRNTFAVGAKALLRANGVSLYQELSPMRGFMSSVDYRIQFGLDSITTIDTLKIEWPAGNVTLLTNVSANQFMDLYEKGARENVINSPSIAKTILKAISTPNGAMFQHTEDEFDDFDRDPLLYNMISNEGPCLCKGDVNGDRLDDFYIGGAKNQAGGLFIQNKNGSFTQIEKKLFDADKLSEDTECVFFDANGDGLDDLYVGSGSNEFSPVSPALAHRLYFSNAGDGLVKSKQVLPVSSRLESAGALSAGDFDADGDVDLFVGTRLSPFRYGLPVNGYILENDGHGFFRDVTSQVAPELLRLGMMTAAAWADLNKDGRVDLVIGGEWMPLKVFLNQNGVLRDKTSELGLDSTNGWYNCLAVADLNDDGYPELIAGNHGLNSRFRGSRSEPVEMYVNDFDQNGSIEHIITVYNHGKSYPMALRNDLVSQIPSLKKKYLRYENYKNQTIEKVFTEAQLKSAIHLNAFELATCAFLNREGKGFTKTVLPREVQAAPVYAIVVDDFDSDGKKDVLIGGNLYRAKPETGIYDASYGLLLKGDGTGRLSKVPPGVSGMSIKGEVRGLITLKTSRARLIVVGKNNDINEFYSY